MAGFRIPTVKPPNKNGRSSSHKDIWPPYQWLGYSDITNFSTTAASEITSTSTIFTIQAGPMKFNATFFTPVEPNDYGRQSIPFTYLFVDGFVADDGNPHSIQLYSDITGGQLNPHWMAGRATMDYLRPMVRQDEKAMREVIGRLQ
ncbi:hypothetical protein AGABI1DRAFT_93734 [Agaricus bisporus var. burnettii JB137-S8]|uniref:Glutaminase A N-terminal domain-containing protein n=1 Tax=Agaricus bisporus var. burnettii (strain JB137-S8 / ATCC MYA-4627 / FGSC 10392) TaxID=597362 RepID=K5WP60_AGABU|nr:uncharacterized protein AGABI1DRAFT_93734 [Agaricus bisporus var. burnettii JB137-S8]EKM77081.1 hypothetical protein AGABI1DRAFT_93734 [Agaricus bisporus var. burnettii JB137-S8]